MSPELVSNEDFGALRGHVMVPWVTVTERFGRHRIAIGGTEYPSIRQVSQGTATPDVAALFDGGYVNAAIGVPGLSAPEEALAAERESLARVHSRYPPFEGTPELRQQAAEFSRLFLNLPPDECEPRQFIATVGGMHAGFVSIMFSYLLGGKRVVLHDCVAMVQSLAGKLTSGDRVPDGVAEAVRALADRYRRTKKRILLIDPGFPVNKLQCEWINVPFTSIDVGADHGPGKTWVDTVRTEAAKGDVVAVLYSNPNNPTGSTYGEKSLAELAEVCVGHDVIAIEDLAYLFMDYTKDYTVPGRPPYIQTIASYMRKRGRYILLYSLSKFAAYAGQGVGVVKLSKTMDETAIDAMPLPLTKATGAAKFGELFPMAIYAMTARVPHSAQVAAAKIFEMANTGHLSDYLAEMRAEYGHRVRRALDLFERNDFALAYPLERSADGVGAALYLTFVHPHYAHGGILTKDLLCFGIGVSTVASCGGRKAAIRFSVSDVDGRRLEQLEVRLAKFAEFRRAASRLIARGIPVEKTHAIACT